MTRATRDVAYRVTPQGYSGGFSEKVALISSLFGIVTIVIGVIMLVTFPVSADLSEGFRTPIIAFEFAKTEADLSFLSGSGDLERLNREKMDAGHVWDMGFPFAYGGFIALMLLRIINDGHRFAWLGVLFAALIVPFDINENLTLLQITEALGNSASTDALLLDLHVATWLKWGAIGVSVAVLALGFSVSKQYVSAVVALMASSSIGVCWMSNSDPFVTESMSAFVFLFFAVLAIKECINSWRIIRVRV